MSTGKEHSGATKQVGIGIVIGWTFTTYFTLTDVVIFTLSIPLALIVTPDWDVDEGFIGDYYIRKIMFTDLFFDIWLAPYRKAIKHRSPLSHWPVLGTLLRVIYIFVPPIVVIFKDQATNRLRLLLLSLPAQLISLLFWWLVGLLLYVGFDIIRLWPLIVGLVVFDSIHWLMDR